MELNLKDRKILYELDKNSRIGLTELAKKIQMSKESLYYRLKKLEDEKIILKYHTVSAHYRFGTVDYKVYLRLKDLSKKKYESLIDFLMENKDVFWIAPCNGRWDLMFGIRAIQMNEFFEIHDMLLEKFSKYIQEKELSISRNALQFNRRWMLDSKEERKTFEFGEENKKIELDKEDRLILNELVNNSRKKIVDISKNTNLSVDVVNYRIKKMEKQKIINGYKCLFNVEKLGLITTKAFIYFKNINQERKKEFIQHIKSLKNSVNVVTTFAPWDLEIIFEIEDYRDYYKIMEEVKDKFSDIIKFYDSVIIFEERKQVFDRTEKI
ncbi:MAG TPA: Lrp/AsnC family transcriptional regulator [Candidatus Pacearchaeota archaeon]|nr:Lrp/AsnC family transcriptional regulator [Candidatus Pacearchaeota archaeon]HQF82739.1 Lrp/AsnC family transcriptional regulator [Candidatus Pacearchaeota archaeon]HQJ57496.1 Lrp/AsnC family transcriptional regulator [Candidatus Pacearchaeota archaeon]